MATSVSTATTAIAQPSESADGDFAGAKRWFVVVLLAAGAIIAYCARTNISAALAYRPFVDHFALSDVDRGLLDSAFFWSYMLLQIPMGWLVDRFGVKFPYAISFFLWCLASAATGLVRSLGELTTLRVLTGAGEAIVTPASFRWMRQHFTEQDSGLAIGIYMLGTKMGPAFGPWVAAVLIEMYDWRVMFAVVGLVGLVWLVPWLLFVKNDRPGASEKAGAAQAGAGLAGAVKARPAKQTVPFANLMASPVIWGTIIINFCYNYFVFYCMTWMPRYFVEQRHMSLKTMGAYTFFSFSGIALVALGSGWIADLIIKRGKDPVFVRKCFVIAGFAIACTEMIGVRSASGEGAAFWAVVSLSGLGMTTANNLALCRMTLIPPQAVGVATGVQNVSTSLAGIVGPILSGWLLQTTGGYEAPMMVILFFLVLGALSCLVLLRPRWSPKVATVPA